MTRLRRVSGSDRGAALIELALALPLLVVIFAATVDFARIFNASISLTNAARAGAQFGAASIGNSGNVAGMQSAATSSIVPNTGVTATASRTCACATNGGVFGGSVGCTSTCPSGQHLVVTVTVSTARTFTTIMGAIPGIPNSVDLTRSATLRVVN